jgi:hypothetical protein
VTLGSVDGAKYLATKGARYPLAFIQDYRPSNITGRTPVWIVALTMATISYLNVFEQIGRSPSDSTNVQLIRFGFTVLLSLMMISRSIIARWLTPFGAATGGFISAVIVVQLVSAGEKFETIHSFVAAAAGVYIVAAL